jgi:hypothetical protein
MKRKSELTSKNVFRNGSSYMVLALTVMIFTTMSVFYFFPKPNHITNPKINSIPRTSNVN